MPQKQNKTTAEIFAATEKSRQRYIETHSRNLLDKTSYLQSSHSLIDELVKAVRENVKSGSTILEVGCGGGHAARFLTELGLLVTAIDFSPVAIEAARQQYPKIDFRTMDAQELDFANGAFDAVISIESIEHLSAPENHVREVRRVLRDGGAFIIKTPNRLVHDAFYLWNSKTRSWHPSVMSPGELTVLLESNGFKARFFKLKRLPSYQIEKARVKFGPLGFIIAPILRTLPISFLPRSLQSSLICIADKLPSAVPANEGTNGPQTD